MLLIAIEISFIAVSLFGIDSSDAPFFLVFATACWIISAKYIQKVSRNANITRSNN